jgi:PAS domain S-box-containing protein
MTLRNQTWWVTGIALVGLFTLLLSVSSTILLQGFTELEKQAVENNVSRLVNALAEQFNNLLIEAEDYAIWDDTYAYMETHDKGYLQSNFAESTFKALNLSLLVILDTHGKIVFGTHYDTIHEQFGPIVPHFDPISPHFLKHLQQKSTLTQNINENGKFFGFLLLPQQIMLIASSPILTTDEQGPSRGTLIMGRNLDDAQMRRLEQITHLPVKVQRLDKHDLPADFAKARTALLNQQRIIQLLDNNHIAGYILTKDIYQQPAALLRVAMPRTIYQQGLTSLWILSSFVLGLAIVFAGFLLWLFERLILARLAQLSHEVTQIETSGHLTTVTVRGNDELSYLATGINKMLNALHTSNEQVRQSEASLAEAQHIAHLGNWEWDRVNKHFFCSDEIYRIFGLKPQSITPTYSLFLSYIHPDDRRKVSNTFKKAIAQQKPCNLEYRIVQQGGKTRFIHTQGEMKLHKPEQMLCLIGTLQDITQLKQAQAETLRVLDENRFLIHRSMVIQEEELKKVAHELHDEFGQCITAIQADAETIAALSVRQDLDNLTRCQKIKPSADAILSISSRAYEVVHSLMRQLRPSGLDELGLVEALHHLVTTWQKRHKYIRCTLTSEGDLYHLGETVNIHLYRIVQESLTNIAKYAKATQVFIHLNSEPIQQILTLCIRDNGRGMYLTQHKRGLGLIGMRERAQALEGDLQLESAPGDGVKITLTIPIAEQYLQRHRKWIHQEETGTKNDSSAVS